jgi:hypothetical protein
MLRIPVVSKDGKPISPTVPSKARKMIRDGVATPKRDKLGNFYIQMNVPVGEEIPHETIAGIDPGKLYSGMAVQTPKATLWIGHLVLPFPEVKKAMKNRKQLRRGRRYRKTPQRECRFLHRTGHKIPPSIRSNRELEYRVLTELRKIYPITEVVYEVVKANGSKSFSPVMVGQKWQINRISKILPITIREGWETSAMRKHLGLLKDREKSKASPQTHAVDGIALAATNLLAYKPYVKTSEHGHLWSGECVVTDAPFSIIQRPLLFRRKLHVENFAKGGIRKRRGGTTTPYIFRKGDYVEAEKAGRTVRGYISGFSEANGVLGIADHRWRRIGQFTVSKVRLLQRSCHLLVDHKNCVSI